MHAVLLALTSQALRRAALSAQALDSLTPSTADDWRLSDATYQELCANPVLQGRTPTLDVFASHLNTKVPGRFYSRYDCPGSLGVDAFQHPWGVIDGQRQLAYIHGPIYGPDKVQNGQTFDRILQKVTFDENNVYNASWSPCFQRGVTTGVGMIRQRVHDSAAYACVRVPASLIPCRLKRTGLIAS